MTKIKIEFCSCNFVELRTERHELESLRKYSIDQMTKRDLVEICQSKVKLVHFPTYILQAFQQLPPTAQKVLEASLKARWTGRKNNRENTKEKDLLIKSLDEVSDLESEVEEWEEGEWCDASQSENDCSEEEGEI